MCPLGNMQQQDTVTSLKAELIRAMDEIKALKDGTSSLQKQLSEKDGLLKKETRKRRHRFRAYVDCLYELTACQAKCERLEASLHQEQPQPETSWGRQMEVEEENQVLKEEVDLLKVGQRRLEDELLQKNQLIVSANEKKRAQTSAHIDCLALLTAKEMELKKSQAETLQLKLQQTPLERLSFREEEVDNQALKEQDNLPKVGPRRQEVKLQQTPLERLSFREEEVDNQNQALKEQDNLPKVGQRRQEVKLQQTRSERLSCRMVEAETIWSREVEVDKENRFLKEQLNLPKVRKRRLR